MFSKSVVNVYEIEFSFSTKVDPNGTVCKNPNTAKVSLGFSSEDTWLDVLNYAHSDDFQKMVNDDIDVKGVILVAQIVGMKLLNYFSYITKKEDN